MLADHKSHRKESDRVRLTGGAVTIILLCAFAVWQLQPEQGGASAGDNLMALEARGENSDTSSGGYGGVKGDEPGYTVPPLAVKSENKGHKKGGHDPFGVEGDDYINYNDPKDGSAYPPYMGMKGDDEMKAKPPGRSLRSVLKKVLADMAATKQMGDKHCDCPEKPLDWDKVTSDFDEDTLIASVFVEIVEVEVYRVQQSGPRDGPPMNNGLPEASPSHDGPQNPSGPHGPHGPPPRQCGIPKVLDKGVKHVQQKVGQHCDKCAKNNQNPLGTPPPPGPVGPGAGFEPPYRGPGPALNEGGDSDPWKELVHFFGNDACLGHHPSGVPPQAMMQELIRLLRRVSREIKRLVMTIDGSGGHPSLDHPGPGAGSSEPGPVEVPGVNSAPPEEPEEPEEPIPEQKQHQEPATGNPPTDSSQPPNDY